MHHPSTAPAAVVLAMALALPAPAQDPEPQPVPVPVPVGVPLPFQTDPAAGTSAVIPSSQVATSEARLPTPAAAPRAVAATSPVVVMPRIREITKPHNVMPHLLTGIGIVTGLAGTGSSDRSTRQAILNFMNEHDIRGMIADVGSGNTALVSLTASLPPFAKEGTPLPVKVQVIGDATSLRGGALLRAELRGVDGQLHAVVQGPLDPGGYTVQGGNASVQKNLSTTATISTGGLVVRSVPSSYFSEAGDLELRVSTPTPFNSASIAAAIAQELRGEGVQVAAVDPTLVRLTLPEDRRTLETAIRLLNRVGNLRVQVENPVRVVIDQATGAVVAGEGIMISPCVIGLTDLTIAIVEDDEVVQPGPLSPGETQRIGRTRIDVQSNSTELKPVSGGATVADLLQNLKALGLSTPQLISVFLTLKKQGFLHAELIVE